VNKARRHAWAQGIARHGGLPPVRVADRKLEGVTCIRLDATVVTAHTCTYLHKERAAPTWKKGYGLPPIGRLVCEYPRVPGHAAAAR
jgi:hypothetical protein